MDLGVLHDFEKGSVFTFPDSWETLYLVYYGLDNNYSAVDGSAFGEDTILINLLKSRTWPSLKEIAVPPAAVGELNSPLRNPSEKKVWYGRRRKMQEDEVFKNGNVKLRILEEGELGELSVEVTFG